MWSFIHVIAAAWISGTVVVIAVAASHLRRGHETGVFTAAVRIALPILVVGVLLAFVAGDRLGGILIEQQPMKMAAAEALLDTEQPAAFSLFADRAADLHAGDEEPRAEGPAPAVRARDPQLRAAASRASPGPAGEIARIWPGQLQRRASPSSTGRSG